MKGHGSQTLLREHDRLRKLASSLGRAFDEPEAMTALTDRLASMETLLARHFEMEELGGYMSWVAEEDPGEQELLRRLRGDHDDLWGRLVQLRHLVNVGAALEELRARVAEWVERLGRHETAENDLIERHPTPGHAGRSPE